MKVPCIHNQYDAHEWGGEWQCKHGPHVAHIRDCGTGRWVGSAHCSGGESPTNEQLVAELRRRGVSLSVDWNILDNLPAD